MSGNLHQRHLRLVADGEATPQPAQDQGAILGLISDLVRFPTQGGVDNQEPALAFLADWLEERGLPVRILEASTRSPKHRPLGLLASVGPAYGPALCITACLDTALFGDRENWDEGRPEVATTTGDGWMIGRGVADSKSGVAIFSALMVEMKRIEHRLKRRVLLLVDSDEHTGRFGAVKRLVEDEKPHIKGVYIGYPGNETIKIGARGFYRAKISIYGVSSHTGASKPSTLNAIEKTSLLIQQLNDPPVPDEVDKSFGLGAQRTTTAVIGGRGYSNVPDSCFLRVDYRLTPSFRLADAKRHLRNAVERVDRRFNTGRDSKIASEQSWPAYKIDENSPLISALTGAARAHLKTAPTLRISGPSNVGNFLYSHGIEATCGFGVNYRNIHAANEAIEVDSVMPIFETYKQAILDLVT